VPLAFGVMEGGSVVLRSNYVKTHIHTGVSEC